jgi:CcmD family protein
VPLVALVLLCALEVSGQSPGGNLGAQSLRPYWHVFAAYAIAWLLIGGWIISISRRLSKLEKRPTD